MGPWVVGFVGGALLYAAAGVLVVLLILRLAGRFPGWRVVPVLFTTLFFVFLTQHPFPDPGTLVCPVPTAEPRLRPFNFWPTFVRLYEQGAGIADWMGNRMVASTVMNLVVCLVIGLTLARHTARLWVALGFGMALTLAVELTQLTGFWGLYACAYREFNVDDLIVNVIGVVGGFLTGRAFVRMRGAPGD
jgi:hypothetical protein